MPSLKPKRPYRVMSLVNGTWHWWDGSFASIAGAQRRAERLAEIPYCTEARVMEKTAGQYVERWSSRKAKSR